MYKVGKVFMEEAKITIDSRGKRIVICPICNYDIDIPDDKLEEDVIYCDWCDTNIKSIE